MLLSILAFDIKSSIKLLDDVKSTVSDKYGYISISKSVPFT